MEGKRKGVRKGSMSGTSKRLKTLTCAVHTEEMRGKKQSMEDSKGELEDARKKVPVGNGAKKEPMEVG